MTTAIVGAGNIGRTIAGQLVPGGERVLLAAPETPDQLAQQLGDLATATTVPEAIDAADVVILGEMAGTHSPGMTSARQRLVL